MSNTSKIEIYPLILTQEEFQRTPAVEREFYLELGLLSNEVSILNRLTLFALRQPENEILNRAGSAQAMLFLRLLSGRLYEAYPVISTGFKHLKVKYRPSMKGGGISSYRVICAYFGNPNNLIKKVRHKLAFHADGPAFRARVTNMDDDEHIVDYMCRARGNTLFWGAEAAMICALKELCETDEAAIAYDRLLGDTNTIAGAVLDFAFAFALGFFKRHFPEKLNELATGRVDLASAPDLMTFSLPWFFDCPKQNPRSFPTGGSSVSNGRTLD